MIDVTVKLGSALDKYLPDGQTSQNFTLQLPADSTVSDIITTLGIPAEQMLLVIVNGEIVHQKDRSAKALRQGDALSVMPPLYAG